MTVSLVCTGPAKFPHGKVVIYRTDEDSSAWWLTMTDCNLELRCKRCHQATRPGWRKMPALLRLAADAGGELDIRR